MFRKRPRGRALSMLELVFALGLIFVSSGGVMSIVVAGAGWPKRTQFAAVRAALAKAELDKYMVSTLPPTPSGGYVPVPSNPDYEMSVDSAPAAFDPATRTITVSVRGPKPQQIATSVSGLYVPTTGEMLFYQYGCNSCHALGAVPPLAAPSLNQAALDLEKDNRNSLYNPDVTLDGYIRESIRTPSAYTVGGFTADMASYTDITSMPNTDLQAISQFIKSY